MLEHPIVQATIIAGSSLIIHEILAFFVFKRLEEFAALRAEIAETLVFYADVYTNGTTASEDACAVTPNVIQG